MEDKQEPGWTSTLGYIIAWLVSTALLIVDLFLARNIIIDMMTSAGLMRQVADPDAWRSRRLTYGWLIDTTDRALLLALACVGIAGSIAIEHHYRKGAAEGKLRRRVIRVMGYELGFGAVALLISWLLTYLLVRLAA